MLVASFVGQGRPYFEFSFVHKVNIDSEFSRGNLFTVWPCMATVPAFHNSREDLSSLV